MPEEEFVLCVLVYLPGYVVSPHPPVLRCMIVCEAAASNGNRIIKRSIDLN